MRAAVRKMGNSSGVILPKSILGEARLKPGDRVEIQVQDGRVVLEPVADVRQGWAEAAALIAAEGDDALVWPEFANAEDEDLAW